MIAVMALAVTGVVGTQTAQAVDPVAHQGNKITFPGNDGKPHSVTWDKNSYMVDGERLVIWSGELHHWRVPHEDGWRDVFQKLRAAGFNAVSLYFFWGLHQSEEGGEFDFTGPRDLDKLLTLAAEEGLYVIARPGPYVNAEISMGGLPAYFTNKSTGSLRGTDPSVLEPSKEWLAAFNDIAREHQVTDGGGSIVMYQVENELIADNEPRRAFLKELAEFVRADGITVPLFHNDYGLGGRFADVENLGLDFYAYDWYPLGFSCDANRGTISDQEANLRRYAPDTPNFITEAQGGAFSPWGAPWTDNDHCKTYVDPAFTRQWGMNNIGQGVTAFNYYMIIGGTNWGYTGAPGSGFTSYDYGAALDEDRTITPKLAVQKELGYYQRGVPQIGSMDPAPRIQPVELSGSATNVYQRVATDDLETSVTGNGVRFIGARLGNSNDTTTTSFAIPLTLGEEGGVITDQFTDDDRSAKITYSNNWNQVAEGTAYKGTLTRSSTAGATATVSFNGTGIEVIAPTSPQYGTATISIDGGAPVTMDASYNTEQNAPAQQTLFTRNDLTPGAHTAVITVTGRAGANATGTAFAVDAINVLGAPSAAPTVYNNSDLDFFTFNPVPVQFRPGGTESARWTHASGHTWTAGNIDGDETYTRTAGDSVQFSFTGTGFDVIAAFSENHGPADVYIDDVLVGKTSEEVVTTGAVPQQVIYSKKDLADGEHTVRLVHTGTFFPGAADSRGAYFSVDAVRVYSGDAPTEPETPTGELAWTRIPQEPGTKLTIHGRDALMLTADLKIGGVHDMLYTTSQIFDAPVETSAGLLQTLIGYRGDAGETVLRLPAGYTVNAPSSVKQTYTAATQQLRLNYTHGAPVDVTVTRADGEKLVLRIMDRETAVDTWHIQGIRGTGNDTVIVRGAYLVRTVKFDGTVAHITGSMDEAGTLHVTLPAGITSYTWNGGTLTNGAAPGPVQVPEPDLNWVKKAETLPVAVDYDDSGWVLANARTALQHRQGPGSNGVVLDSNRYGFHNGSVWYRAEYTAADTAPTQLSFQGNAGTFGAQRKNPGFFQVWVNGVYAGARPLNGSTQSVPVPAGTITGGQQVVVTVLANNLGLNLDWSDDGLSRQNRGLYQANLGSKAGTETWRILGSADPFGQVDQMRGMYNTGGKIGEREGWHLPGVDTTGWAAATTMEATEPGVAWYRTNVDLNVPAGQDTVWRLELDVDNFGSTHQTRTNGSQVDLYVNGWNIGVFIGDVGPQKDFTIPAGFLDPTGRNEIAVSVVAKSAGQGPNDIRLVPVHSTTGAPADFEPYPTINQAQYLAGIRTTPSIAIDAAPASLNWGQTGTITYSLTNVPTGSTLTIDAPEGWTVTPATQTTSGDTATVTVTAPESGTSGTITARVRTPQGRTASVGQAIKLTDPSVLPIQGIVAWNTAEPAEGGSNGFITALTDGNPATHWHSRWSGGTTPFPHYVVLDLGSVQDVSSLTYLPRTGCGIPNNPPACNGTVNGYQVFVATEGDFVSPTAAQLRQVAYPEPTGVTYTKVAEGNFGGASTGPETVEFDAPVQARYVKFVSTSANAGQAWSSGAELTVSGPAEEPGDTTGPVIATIPAQTGTIGRAITPVTVIATDASTPLTYALSGAPGLTINATTGVISGTPTEAGTHTGNVTVTDAAGNVSTRTFTFTVAAAPVEDTTDPVISVIAPVTGTVGTAITPVTVIATDASTPLTYALSGAPGLTIDATTGVISGTPTEAGTHTGNVTVTDAAGNVSTRTFTFTVAAAPVEDTTGPVITAVPALQGVVGTAIAPVSVKATDPSGPLTYALSGVPGLRINATTGVITGTPTTVGTHTGTVTVTDAEGNESTTTFRVTVKAKPTPPPPGKPKFVRTIPYTMPGEHLHNGRQWRTTCEDYSQTERCRTEIWASVVKRTGNAYSIERGWAFNNLTYLPFMERAKWASNPLGFTNEWTGTDRAQWRTECDTKLTGGNACRSFRYTTVYYATPRAGGGYSFGQENKWVFNNIVMFGNYSR